MGETNTDLELYKL